MGRHKNRDGVFIPAGLRIRFEVINRMYRNPDESVRIPSVRELAARYCLSPSTVSLELKKLVKEGFLVGKHGSGTYTNPRSIQFAPSAVKRRIVGILVGDGKLLIYDAMDWYAMTHCGMAFSPDQAQPRVCGLVSSTPDEICGELLSQNLDGLIWVHPSPDLDCNGIIRILRREGLPVIALNSKDPEGPAISYSPVLCGEKIGKQLVEEKRDSIFFFPTLYDNQMEQKLKGLRDFVQGRRERKIEIRSFELFHTCADELERMFAEGRAPGAIYCNGNTIFGILELVARYNIDIKNRCRLLAEEPNIVQRNDFHGYAVHYPVETIRREIVRRMELLWKDPGAEIPVCYVEPELKFYL